MIKSVLASVALAGLLGACALTASDPQPYQEPGDGAAAFVNFRNATSGRASVAVYQGAERCTERRFLPDLLIGEESAIRIRAGEPFAFTFRYSVPNSTPPRTCQVTASFPTKPDARYLVNLRRSGETSCIADIHQVEVQPDGELKPIASSNASLRTLARAPRDESGPFCLPLGG